MKNSAVKFREIIPESVPIYSITFQSTMVFAAMDTSSSALSHIIYLLAKHEDAQHRLREEIVSASKGQDIPYYQLTDLPFLDAICKETLRL